MNDWRTALNILCVRLDSMGDVVMTSPALRALKQSCSRRRITLLASPAGTEAGRLIPEVDDLITWDAPWLKASSWRTDGEQDRRFCEELRARRFDAAVIFTVFSQSPLPAALLCFLADIPLRLAHCRENPYQLLTDWVVETEPHQCIRHEVERQLQLVESIGCVSASTKLSLRVSQSAESDCDRILTSIGLDLTRAWLMIHPGASAPSRRYPIEQFAVVADRLCDDGFQVVISGSNEERTLVQEMQRSMQHSSWEISGRLDLETLSAVLSRAPLLLTNNTGPAHLAAAVGTPVVDLYALTNPQHTPWKVPCRVLSYDVPCRNCFKSVCPEGHHDCLRRITPEEIVRAVRELYRECHETSALRSLSPLTEKVA